MSDRNQEKCGNPGCSCKAAPESKYCSPPCEGMGEAKMAEIACGCGHADCAGNIAG